MDLGALLLTEVNDLDIPKILSMRDRHLRTPTPEGIRAFLCPPERGKDLTIYEVCRGEASDYFLGNGNKRVIALALGGIPLPEYVVARDADQEAQAFLERNATAFFERFGVRTAPEFIDRYLQDERLRRE